MLTAYQDAPDIEEVIYGRDCDDIGGLATVELIRDTPRGPEVRTRYQVWVKKRHAGHNLIVNSGKVQIWRRVMGLQPDIFDQFRIGTSGAAAASGQTNVLSPVAGSILTADNLSVLAGTRSAQWDVSYPSGVASLSAANIREVCLLNSNTSPGGSCMMRALFAPLTKTEADKLRIVYQARIN
ncbi:hypothetical protein LCGC14_0273630 [marine sediment metagenome]|uniref:Uncharacterized protein n=2 Tax=root TaxID=1 RepID=A0A9C9TIL0_9HYPH|nr:hypothetical protein [Aurantimonas coralicida]